MQLHANTVNFKIFFSKFSSHPAQPLMKQCEVPLSINNYSLASTQYEESAALSLVLHLYVLRQHAHESYKSAVHYMDGSRQ